MDPLLQHDIKRARDRGTAEQMQLVLATVDEGLRIRRAMIRAKRPSATEAEIDAELRKWLLRDEPTSS